MSWLRRNKEILILFLFALMLKLFVVLTAQSIASDGCSYLWLAEDIAKGDFQSGINAFLPPLFPILSAAFSFVFKDFELSGRLVSCMLGSLTVFPLFFLIKDIFNKKIAIITVVFFIIHPYLLRTSGEVLTEATYFFLITSLAFFLWKALQSSKTTLFLLVGFVACLTFLARPEGIAIIFLILGWIWFAKRSNLKNKWRWKLTASFFCLITYILILLPFYLHFHQQSGSWKPTTRHLAFVDDKGVDEGWSQAAVKVLKWKMGNVPGLFHAVPQAYYPPFLILLIFGLLNRKKFKGYNAGEGFILSFIIFRILIVTIFAGVTDRYFYAFVPMALSWAALGFWEIDNQLLQKFRTSECRIGKEKISRISLMILLVIAVLCLPKGLKPIRANRSIQKKVGYWLKEHAGKDKLVILATKPQEAFYAGAKFYELRKGSYEEAINQAKEINPDFVIIDRNIKDICPGFNDMVKQEDLEVFSREFESSKRKIVVYKLRK